VTATALLLLTVAGTTISHPQASAAPRGASALSLTIDARHPGPRVPSDFLGLSFEAKYIARIGGYAQRGNLVNLMRSLGTGLLRFGGVTADTQAAWVPPGAVLPSWATTPITPADLEGVADLYRRTRWRVLLAVNLGHLDPDAAASEARAAALTLGRGLAAIELGNEPNSYASHGLRNWPWGFEQYLPEAELYRDAIRRQVPDAAIAGPDASTGPRQDAWASSAAAALVPELLTAHFYPLSHCAAFSPLVEDLNSLDTRQLVSGTMARLGALSRDAGQPLRLDEVNNISCGGQAGVSETFASALSAVDLITAAMSQGLAGINFHGAVENPHGYAPIAACRAGGLLSGELCAQPEYYGLLLTRLLVGGRPLPIRRGGADRASVGASAFRGPGGSLRIVLVDHRPAHGPAVLVRLALPRGLRGGSVLRLTAPAASATRGVTLGGKPVDATGRWAPRGPLPTVRNRRGAALVWVPATSATLLTFTSAR
jgi:hypothetical protein